MKGVSVMKSYKAFNAGYVCLNYPYKDGVNICKGEIRLCSNGFHSCPDPNNLTYYYNVEDDNVVFAIVDVYSDTDINFDDLSKIASKKLKIVKKFDKYEDVLAEFKVNGNPTIKYIEENYKESDEFFTFDYLNIPAEAIKDILKLSDTKKVTMAKALFVGFMVKLSDCNAFSPLDDFAEEIQVITHGLKNKNRIIEEFVEKHASYKRLFNKLTNKQKTELLLFVNEFNRRYNIDLEKYYSDFLLFHKKQKAFKPKQIFKLMKGI